MLSDTIFSDSYFTSDPDLLNELVPSRDWGMEGLGGELITSFYLNLEAIALATLLSAITGRTRGGDMLLPILAVPIFVPALIAGVKASAAALAGVPLESMGPWLKIMVAFDVLFVTAGYLLFEQVVGED